MMKLISKVVKEVWITDHVLKLLTLVSLGLIIASFIIPPTGVIDPSVLAAVGEIMGIAAIFQFRDSYNNGLNTKVRIKEIELEIQGKNNEE